MKILLIEDHIPQQEMFYFQIERFNYMLNDFKTKNREAFNKLPNTVKNLFAEIQKPKTFDRGDSGLVAFNSDLKDPYDIVLMDTILEDGAIGPAIAKDIRQVANKNNLLNLKIFSISSDALSEQDLKNAGIDKYIGKQPIPLLSVLQEHIVDSHLLSNHPEFKKIFNEAMTQAINILRGTPTLTLNSNTTATATATLVSPIISTRSAIDASPSHASDLSSPAVKGASLFPRIQKLSPVTSPQLDLSWLFPSTPQSVIVSPVSDATDVKDVKDSKATIPKK